ncbi:hypothetical protein ABFX02_08G201500 [Erythranthe guttata]
MRGFGLEMSTVSMLNTEDCGNDAFYLYYICILYAFWHFDVFLCALFFLFRDESFQQVEKQGCLRKVGKDLILPVQATSSHPWSSLVTQPLSCPTRIWRLYPFLPATW